MTIHQKEKNATGTEYHVACPPRRDRLPECRRRRLRWRRVVVDEHRHDDRVGAIAVVITIAFGVAISFAFAFAFGIAVAVACARTVD